MRGLILELSDKVTLTTAFTARKTNRAVIGFFIGFHRCHFYLFLKKLTYNLCFIKVARKFFKNKSWQNPMKKP